MDDDAGICIAVQHGLLDIGEYHDLFMDGIGKGNVKRRLAVVFSPGMAMTRF